MKFTLMRPARWSRAWACVLVMLGMLLGSTAWASVAPEVAVAAGGEHSLALSGNGSVWAWGDNYYGQLGDGTTSERLHPLVVPGLTGVVAVAAGYSHSLAVKSDGTVWAWGDNYFGQLGDGTRSDRLHPVAVPGLTGVVAVSADSLQSLAVKSDGTVWAWGNNDYSEIAYTVDDRLNPEVVPGLTGVVAVAAGRYHSLALKSDGTVWAWGNNSYGQLGDDAVVFTRLNPKAVPGLTGVIAVAASGYQSVAVKLDGTVWAWGDNHYGQLGNGTWSANPGRVPTVVPLFHGVVAVSVGGLHSLALKSDGTVWAWGDYGRGQLGGGMGSGANFYYPTRIYSLTGVKAVAAGDSHSLAMKFDGSAWAWGSNTYRQLGDDTTIDRWSPVPVHLYGW